MTIIVLVCAVGGVGTYAWFVNSASSTDNTFETGTLSIDSHAEWPQSLFATQYDDEYVNEDYAVGYWFPGKKVSGDDRTLMIKNTGTLPICVFGISAVMPPEDFFNPSGEPDAYDEFAENLIVTVKVKDEIYYQGSLVALLEGIQPLRHSDNDYINVNPQNMTNLNFEAELSVGAGNAVQGVSATVDLIIHATQNDEEAIKQLLNE